MSPKAPQRQPHAVLNLPSRHLKAMKIERLLYLSARRQPLKLLEVGTGSGGIAHHFASHPTIQCDVAAVDVMDQRLLRNGYAFHLVEDISLPFQDGYFDVVITNHVIEHVGDLNEQRGHLREVRRVMNPKGIGYLAVPNRWMLIEPHYRLAFLSWLPSHLRSPYLRLMRRGGYYDCRPLSLATLENFLEKTGFQYQNLCTQALRETLSLEGKKGIVSCLIAKLPDNVYRHACSHHSYLDLPDRIQDMNTAIQPAIWFPAIRAGSGADVFTVSLAEGLRQRGLRAEITWLPHRAEYAPWTVTVPKPPEWANIAHVNTWLPKRFLGTSLPLIATMHNCVHDAALSPYKSKMQAIYHRAWVKRLEQTILKRACRVVAVSNYTAAHTREIYSVPEITVIHNGIDLSGAFQANPNRQPHQPFRLLFVGNWSSRKGVDLLFPIMHALGPDFELHFTAEESATTRPTMLPANTRAIGWQKTTAALADIYRDADALLFPSRLEGFGLVALEAQACGLPVIATHGSARRKSSKMALPACFARKTMCRLSPKPPESSLRTAHCGTR